MDTSTDASPAAAPASPAARLAENFRNLGGPMSMFALSALVVAFLAGAISVAAMSRVDDASDAAIAAATGVTVSLTEFTITPDPIVVPVDGVITVKNVGSVEHLLKVKDHAEFTTKTLAPGETTQLSLKGLPEGNYTVICTVGGHDQSGMVAAMTIGTASSDAAASGGHGAHGNLDNDEVDRLMAQNTLAFAEAATTGRQLTEGKGGQPLEPVIAADGVKEFRLTASEIQWEVEPGKFVNAMAYNGQVPGPTLRADHGDRVRIILDNQLSESTVIHFHGIIVPNEMDGVPDLTQPPVKPGETFTYEFDAIGPAVGMYHSHHHADKQVPAGLAGAFLIGDLGLDVPVTQEYTMMLNDSGEIGLSLNGKSFPATEPIFAKVGDKVLIHYLNEGNMVHPMHLHGIPQKVVAKDGFPLAEPYMADTVLIAPGERFSVLVDVNLPGLWAFHCHILTHAESSNGMFGMVTAMIVSE